MKTAQIGFMFIALCCALCAIWLPGMLWQFLISSGVLLVAAAGIEATTMTSEKDDKK